MSDKKVSEVKHTPEPWTVDQYGRATSEAANKFLGICVDGFSLNGSNESKANARRIVAAVNACAGISTDRLEQGVKPFIDSIPSFSESINVAVETIEKIAILGQQRDQLLEALIAMTDSYAAISIANNYDPNLNPFYVSTKGFIAAVEQSK